MSQRILRYEKPTYYSNKVLIGPWVEARASQVQKNYKHSTTYNDNFTPKTSSNDDSIIWDLRLKAENTNFIPQIGRHDFPNFFENFSSTYDLSYNHFPRCFKSYIPRVLRFRLETYEPNEDYIRSFGNITNYGLASHLRQKWKCELSDPRLTYSSDYEDTFKAPTPEDYKFKRHQVSAKFLNKIAEDNMLEEIQRLRGKSLAREPLIQVSREARCNPITWECPEINCNGT